jgi:hypothetical protein
MIDQDLQKHPGDRDGIECGECDDLICDDDHGSSAANVGSDLCGPKGWSAPGSAAQIWNPME